jgi:hypothetical protein
LPVAAAAQQLKIAQRNGNAKKAHRAIAEASMGAAGVEGIDLALVNTIDSASVGDFAGDRERLVV